MAILSFPGNAFLAKLVPRPGREHWVSGGPAILVADDDGTFVWAAVQTVEGYVIVLTGADITASFKIQDPRAVEPAEAEARLREYLKLPTGSSSLEEATIAARAMLAGAGFRDKPASITHDIPTRATPVLALLAGKPFPLEEAATEAGFTITKAGDKPAEVGETPGSLVPEGAQLASASLTPPPLGGGIDDKNLNDSNNPV